MNITAQDRLFLLHSDSFLRTLADFENTLSFAYEDILSLRAGLMNKLTNEGVIPEEQIAQADHILGLEERLSSKVKSLKGDLLHIHRYLNPPVQREQK